MVPKVELLIQQSSTAICNNDSVLLFVNDNYSSYLWSNGDTTSSIYVSDEQFYSLMVTNSIGCEYFSDTIHITSAQYTYPVSIVGDTVICLGGESILFTSAVLPNIIWNNQAVSSSISVDSSGSYFFNGIDTNGCSVVSDTITITQVSNPTPSLVLDTATFFKACFGDTILLTAENNFISYEWSIGDSTQSISITQPGEYYVEATDSNGCIGISDSIEVVFTPLPIVKINPLPDTLCLNDSVFITSTANLESYSWFNGVTTPSFYLPLDSSGLYQISLEGSDSNGCVGIDSSFFRVIDCVVYSSINNEEDFNIEINNFISQLQITTNKELDKVEIYDYQGKVVYSKTNINTSEIVINLKLLTSSTYIIKVTYRNIKEPSFKKNVLLKK